MVGNIYNPRLFTLGACESNQVVAGDVNLLGHMVPAIDIVDRSRPNLSSGQKYAESNLDFFSDEQ
jgi:hypothetical protein